jgi:hypothetical protein
MLVAKMLVWIDPSLSENVEQSFIEQQEAILKKWKALKRSLYVRGQLDGSDRLSNINGKTKDIVIPYVEEWEDIVCDSHKMGTRHQGIKKTIKEIIARGWAVGTPSHRIAKAYIEEVIKNRDHCCAMRMKKPIWSSSRKEKPRTQYNEEHLNIPTENLEAYIDDIILRHKVHLKKLRENPLTTIPFVGTSFYYRCHWGGSYQPGDGSSIEISLWFVEDSRAPKYIVVANFCWRYWSLTMKTLEHKFCEDRP